MTGTNESKLLLVLQEGSCTCMRSVARRSSTAPQYIYILLDDLFIARISDFGSAKPGSLNLVNIVRNLNFEWKLEKEGRKGTLGESKVRAVLHPTTENKK